MRALPRPARAAARVAVGGDVEDAAALAAPTSGRRSAPRGAHGSPERRTEDVVVHVRRAPRAPQEGQGRVRGVEEANDRSRVERTAHALGTQHAREGEEPPKKNMYA